MSKYANLIKEARSTESQQTSKPETQEEQVNLSVKVPKRLRRHWVAEAKRHDTTLTAAIVEALKSRFGEPT